MKKMIDEFKTFIARGNVIELAVGVIMGSAFGKIVTSLVDNILMPLLGVITGGINLNNALTLRVKDATIYFGSFLQNVIDFVIVAFCIFLLVKFINKLFIKEKKKEEAKKSDEILLLEEIRDLLKENKKSSKKDLKEEK